MRASLIVFCALSFACSDTPKASSVGVDAGPNLPQLVASDVSVLFPLPSTASEPGYLSPADQGALGELLTQTTYDKIPKFGVKPSEGLDFARMRVVAARFDACFKTANGCQAQVRLVMQPITDKSKALDSALHLFYQVPDASVPTLVTSLRKLHALAPETTPGALDVHPALVGQGVTGAYGSALRDLILQYAGDQTFVRMTFFLRAPPKQEEWFFGGFDRVDGELKTLRIVGVGAQNQRVDRVATAAGYNYVFTPNPTAPEDTSALLVSEKAVSAPREDVEKAANAFARIENPSIYGPDDLPCAGCHVTTVVRHFSENELGIKSTEALKSKLTTTSEAAVTPSSLRAFGYFADKPMVANRVLHESEAVVQDMESRFPAN